MGGRGGDGWSGEGGAGRGGAGVWRCGGHRRHRGFSYECRTLRADALFEAREEPIDGAKATAQKLTSEASGADKSFEERLRDVRTKAGVERDRLKAEGRDLERGLLERVRVEIEAKTAETETQIAARAVELRGELTRSVPGLANQIASKLLEREVK